MQRKLHSKFTLCPPVGTMSIFNRFLILERSLGKTCLKSNKKQPRTLEAHLDLDVEAVNCFLGV